MRLNGRTRLLTAGLAAALALGVVGAGAAIAQDGGDPPTAETEREYRHPHVGHRILKGLLHSIVDNSGIEPATFREGFAAGKSINEVLQENGADPGVVQGAVLADADAKLDELVGAGTLTQPQADRIYAAAEEKLPALMDRVPDTDRRDGPRRGVVARFFRGLVRSAAEALAIEPRALAERLRGGESVADVAAEQGVALETVEADVLADAESRIDQAVAEERIDEEQGERMKSRLDERIESFLTERRPERE
jgi:hypothetical protein